MRRGPGILIHRSTSYESLNITVWLSPLVNGDLRLRKFLLDDNTVWVARPPTNGQKSQLSTKEKVYGVVINSGKGINAESPIIQLPQ
jgi:hypothetical protein